MIRCTQSHLYKLSDTARDAVNRTEISRYFLLQLYLLVRVKKDYTEGEKP